MQASPSTSSRQPGSKATASVFVIVCLFLLACGNTAPAGTPLTEASGIFFENDTLWIVSDDVPGTIFVYPLASVPASGVIPIDTASLLRQTISCAAFIGDLESIDRQSDGRFLVLSEDLHALCRIESDHAVNSCKLAVQFDQTVTELGNRGLEGLAVKALADGRLLFAAAWEGGYPEYCAIPHQLRSSIGHLALEPIVIIDTLPPSGTIDYLHSPAYYLTLQTPRPDTASASGQRFRISDLVWNQNAELSQGDRFIALLSSADSPDIQSGQKRRFQYKWLVQYDLTGFPVSAPCDITPLLKDCWARFAANELNSLSAPLQSHAREFGAQAAAANWENVNWEGLAWFEPGKSLVLIYDGSPVDPPFAFVIHLPEEWR